MHFLSHHVSTHDRNSNDEGNQNETAWLSETPIPGRSQKAKASLAIDPGSMLRYQLPRLAV